MSATDHDSRAPFTAAIAGLLLAACQGHTPGPDSGPAGPPAAASRGVFDPAAVGPGAPPQPGPARPLDVLDYGPIGRTEGNGQIHVRFNQPVVPLDLTTTDDATLTKLFTFDPPLPGRAYWKAPDLLAYSPDESLADCHSYKATFAGGVVGLDGQRFDRPLTWTFETVRPTVLGSRPVADATDQRRDLVVFIELDRPARLAEVRAHVEATARPIVDVEPDADADVDAVAVQTPPAPVAVTVRPATVKEIRTHFYDHEPDSIDLRRYFAVKAKTLWPVTSEVEVAVTPGLVTEAGPLPLDTPWSMRFQTYRPQAISSLSCDPAAPCGLEPIRLTLRNPVTSKQARRITLTPRPHGLTNDLWDDAWEPHGREISFSGMFIPGTTYTVHVPADMRDIYGQTLPGGADRPALVAPRATIALSGSGGILVAGKPDQPQTIGVESRHVRRLSVRLGVFDELEMRGVSLAPPEFNRMAFPADTREHIIDLTPSGQGDWSSVALDLAELSGGARRTVLVEVSAAELVPAAEPYGAPTPLRGLFRLTDLGPVAVTSVPASSVQVIRLSTGEPVAGARVAKHDLMGGTLAVLGETGPDGQLVLPADLVAFRDGTDGDKYRATRLVVSDPGHDDQTFLDVEGPWSADRWRGRSAADELKAGASDLRPGERLIARLVSERGVYRPGELVRVVGWSALDTPFSRSNLGRLPAGTGVKFELVDPYDQVVAVHPTVTTGEGKFWAELTLPAEARLGGYDVRATIGGATVEISVKVEDYRVPEFAVEATVRRPDILAGETTDVDVRASYYFGGPVPIQRLTSATRCYMQRYRPPGLDPEWTVGELLPYSHRFHGNTPRVVHPRPSPDTPGHVLHASTPQFDEPRHPGRCTLDFEVQDVSLQGIGAEASYNVHPAAFYLAVATPRDYPHAGDRGPRLPVRAVDFAGNRVAAKNVTVEVVRRHEVPKYRAEGGAQVYDGTTEKTEKLKTCTLDLPATGDDPTCDLPTAEEGAHDVLVDARDPAGREAHTRAGYRVWPKLRHWDWRTLPPPDRLEVALSKTDVRPGDALEVVVRGPWNGALVLARGGIREMHPFTLADQVARFTFPVDDTWTPTVFFEAIAVVPHALTHRSRPRIERATASVDQTAEHRYLRVQVDAPAHAGPGDSIPLGVRVRDSADRPTAARVALWAVDEAVLDLTGYEVPDILPSFVVSRQAETTYHDDLAQIVFPFTPTPDDPWFDVDNYIGLGNIGTMGHGGGYGSGSGAGFGSRGSVRGAPPARSRFETTPVFLADLVVGDTGEARVTAELPDNLTTFRVTAVASARLEDGESPGRFGKNDARTVVTAPLIVRGALPRQLRPGDAAEAAAIIQNNTATPGKVSVTAIVVDQPGSQGHVLKLLSPATAEAELPAGGQVRLPFQISALVPGVPEFELQAAFTPQDGGAAIHDGVRVPLPVAPERTLTERVAVYGTVDDDQPVSIPVKIPDSALPGFGGVTVAATSSLLGGLEDAVDSLVDYPHGCVEQTSSRLLPLVALHDLVKTYPLGVADPVLFMRAGVDRLLTMQTRSGGFGYWPGADEVHPYASAYATWVLHLASKAGYPVPEDALNKALDDLARRVESTSLAEVRVDWGYYDGARLAIALHVLADAGRDVLTRTMELHARRQSLPLFARAFVLLALHRMNPQAPEVTALAAELRGNLQELPATAHTSEATIYNLDEYFHSDARSDAILLMALLRVSPDHPVVIKLARGLLERRVGGKWRNTQENAYALVALADYARIYEAEVPDFTARAWVAQRSVLDTTFKGRDFTTRSVTTDMADIVGLSPTPEKPLDIILQREGQGRLYYRLGAEWAPGDVNLPARSQGLTVTRELRVKAGRVTDAVTAGEPVAMDITLKTDIRVRYLAIDVPLPAGLEAVSHTLGKGRAAATLGGQRGWWATHEEQRPDRVVIFADDLQPGTHHHTVDLRATSRGQFSLPPVHAEAMYMPEVYGRTTGTTLAVR
jgi:uncharacterized protein YfaS (alpha-2-macroglobulin family)